MSGFEIARHSKRDPQSFTHVMEEHGLQVLAIRFGGRNALKKATVRKNFQGQFPTLTRSCISTLMKNSPFPKLGRYTDRRMPKTPYGTRLWKAGYRCRNKRDISRTFPNAIKGSCMFTEFPILTEIKRLYCEEGRSAHEIAKNVSTIAAAQPHQDTP